MIPKVGPRRFPMPAAMPPLETALLQAWQGDYAAWQEMRKVAVDNDLGQDPTNRLLLLLGEEIVVSFGLSPEQKALDAYLFEIAREPTKAGRWAIAEGITPMIGHFASRRTRGQLPYVTYERPLIESLLQYLHTAMDAPDIDLSLSTGLTGMLLSIGSIFDNDLFSGFSHPAMTEIEDLLKKYLNLLQQSRFPIDASQEQFIQFPSKISRTDDLWEEPENGGWAEGDLGQALLLTSCGRWLNQPDLLKWGNRVAAFTIHRRKIGQMVMQTPTIRYGMAGMMRLYQRIYDISGEPTIELEAQRWRQELHTLLPQLEVNAAYDHSLLDGMLGLYGTLQTLTDSRDLPLRALLL